MRREEVASGYCGGEGDRTNLTWVFDSNGVLTITGEGEMKDWLNPNTAPWYEYREMILSLTVEPGVTSIGNQSFLFCENMTSVTLPDTITKLGKWAFEYTGITSIDIPASVTSIGNGAFAHCNALQRLRGILIVP